MNDDLRFGAGCSGKRPATLTNKKLDIMAEIKGKIGVTTENIFPVIKQFLYSDHEIFLRELVANAVDATEKMKALA